MWWDEPARTIKRECGHVGNGRYAHPEQHRLCTVREMALLQGFPRKFRFDVSVIGNAYRHLGDAVPPLISFQLAALVKWMLSGQPPTARDLCLPGTSCGSATSDRSRRPLWSRRSPFGNGVASKPGRHAITCIPLWTV